MIVRHATLEKNLWNYFIGNLFAVFIYFIMIFPHFDIVFVARETVKSAAAIGTRVEAI